MKWIFRILSFAMIFVFMKILLSLGIDVGDSKFWIMCGVFFGLGLISFIEGLFEGMNYE